MDYTIQQDGSTWTLLCNGRPFLTGLSREDAIAKGREFQRAAIVAGLA